MTSLIHSFIVSIYQDDVLPIQVGNSVDKQERISAFKELIYWDGGMEQLYKVGSVMIKGHTGAMKSQGS